MNSSDGPARLVWMLITAGAPSADGPTHSTLWAAASSFFSSAASHTHINGSASASVTSVGGAGGGSELQRIYQRHHAALHALRPRLKATLCRHLVARALRAGAFCHTLDGEAALEELLIATAAGGGGGRSGSAAAIGNGGGDVGRSAAALLPEVSVLANVLLSTRGVELTQLKHFVDHPDADGSVTSPAWHGGGAQQSNGGGIGGGGHGVDTEDDAFPLPEPTEYVDMLTALTLLPPPLRAHVLHHIRVEAAVTVLSAGGGGGVVGALSPTLSPMTPALVSSNDVDGGRGRSGWHWPVKIYSDVDDTVAVRLYDCSFPRGTVYPGYTHFIRALRGDAPLISRASAMTSPLRGARAVSGSGSGGVAAVAVLPPSTEVASVQSEVMSMSGVAADGSDQSVSVESVVSVTAVSTDAAPAVALVADMAAQEGCGGGRRVSCDTTHPLSPVDEVRGDSDGSRTLTHSGAMGSGTHGTSRTPPVDTNGAAADDAIVSSIAAAAVEEDQLRVDEGAVEVLGGEPAVALKVARPVIPVVTLPPTTSDTDEAVTAAAAAAAAVVITAAAAAAAPASPIAPGGVGGAMGSGKGSIARRAAPSLPSSSSQLHIASPLSGSGGGGDRSATSTPTLFPVTTPSTRLPALPQRRVGGAVGGGVFGLGGGNGAFGYRGGAAAAASREGGLDGFASHPSTPTPSSTHALVACSCCGAPTPPTPQPCCASCAQHPSSHAPLTMASASASSSNPLVPRGDLVFLSARPSFLRSATVSLSVNLGLKGAAVLCGTLSAALTHSRMAGRKLSNHLLHGVMCYPEYRALFVGDSGQADIAFALKMIAAHARVAAAAAVSGGPHIALLRPPPIALINDICGPDQVPITSHLQRARLRARGVHVVDSYVDAAVLAHRAGALCAAGVRAVIDGATEDLAAVVFASDLGGGALLGAAAAAASGGSSSGSGSAGVGASIAGAATQRFRRLTEYHQAVTRAHIALAEHAPPPPPLERFRVGGGAGGTPSVAATSEALLLQLQEEQGVAAAAAAAAAAAVVEGRAAAPMVEMAVAEADGLRAAGAGEEVLGGVEHQSGVEEPEDLALAYDDDAVEEVAP